jgi:peptidoglycan hydrolase-like protein with peptidoglycan-binding domain
MTRFHRNRKSGFRGRAIVLLATTACMGSAHAVEPERVIFAAENALYGAGFDIGRADGWIDGKLQEAIRGYQTANGLQANGTLDAATLKALGVHAAPATTIAANSVASRQQSAEVLGLASPAPTPPAPTVAKAETEPTPEPQSEPQATPEPRNQPEKKIETVAESAPEKPADQRISKETSTPIEVEATGGTVVVAEKPEPATAETPAPATEPDPEPEPAVVVVDTAPSDSPAEKDPVLAQLPNEPTSAGNPQPEEPVAQEPESSQSAQLDKPEPVNQTTANKSQSSGGGFFSALFDFFFGWLV